MNKDQLKIKLQTLKFFKGDIDLKFIKGFMSNDSYIVSNDGNKYTDKMLKRYKKQFDYYNNLRK